MDFLLDNGPSCPCEEAGEWVSTCEAHPTKVCDCKFTPDPNDPDDEWHYRRTCPNCGFDDWWTLHCEHDGYQNRCPECRVRPTPIAAMEKDGRRK